MAKIINLFNHKGGVSKTTTVFNLSWMLGSLEKRVLMADFDPQCNLTGMVLGYQGIDDLENTYQFGSTQQHQGRAGTCFRIKAQADRADRMCPSFRQPKRVPAARAHWSC